jgi:putative transposase
MVTAGTNQKQHLFRGPERLDLLEASLLTIANEAGWQLEAWAVFSNHYHFIGHSRPDSQKLNEFTKRLHAATAVELNRLDGEQDRQVWFNYWDTQLTFEKSYHARLHYVHQNPVKHGLVRVANQYRWCSAAWFERTATPAQVKTIYAFKIDRIKVLDEYEPV